MTRFIKKEEAYEQVWYLDLVEAESLEAAKAWVENPTVENTDAADRASALADAAAEREKQKQDLLQLLNEVN